MSVTTSAAKTAMILAIGLSCLVGACSRTENAPITIKMGTVERVNDCHVRLELVRYYKDDSPMGDFLFVCDVPESALKEKKWWGDQTPPLMFSLLEGDCMRLKKTWYCVEAFDPGKSVTIKATFKTVDSDITHINRIR